MNQSASSISKASVINSTTTENQEEESGWTDYFYDLSESGFGESKTPGKTSRDEEDSCWSDFGSPSLVSDAASFPPWKSSSKHLPSGNNLPKKISLRRKRSKEICNDHHDLEDTASSPVNSPKVTEQHRDMNFNIEDSNNEFTELKKRGLCLVPFSTFLYYLG